MSVVVTGASGEKCNSDVSSPPIKLRGFERPKCIASVGGRWHVTVETSSEVEPRTAFQGSCFSSQLFSRERFALLICVEKHATAVRFGFGKMSCEKIR